MGDSRTQYDEKNEEQVISYFSARLSTAEENYLASDSEIVGLIYFLKRFRCYLEESFFKILTDHQIFKTIFNK